MNLASQIIEQWNNYYIDEGQNERNLNRLLLFENTFSKNATTIPTQNQIIKMALATLTEIVQGFQNKWTPKGVVDFEPNEIILTKLKVDYEFYPDDIEESWLGFLASNNLDRKTWPIVRWIAEKLFIPQIVDDLERNALYKGVKQPITAGTPGATVEALNGLQYQLKTRAGINRLTPITLDASTIYDQLEQLYEEIQEEYQSLNMGIYLAPKWYRAFLKDKRTLGFYQITTPGQINDSLDFSPANVIAMPSMIGTNDIFITHKSNLIYAVKKSENQSRVQIENIDRLIKLYTDFFIGVGFAINQAVWTTVQAETPPPPEE